MPSTTGPTRRLPAALGRVAGALAGGAVLVALAAAPAGAHTGTGAGGGAVDGLAHPLLGWDHLLAMVAVGLVAALVSRRRVAIATPVAFVAAVVAGGVLGVAGVPLPAVEAVIVGSVVVLGAVVVAGPHGGWWLPAVASVCGLAHGHAHGAEVPGGALPVAFLAGAVLATAGLHLAGYGLGTVARDRVALRRAAGAAIALGGAAVLLAG